MGHKRVKSSSKAMEYYVRRRRFDRVGFNVTVAEPPKELRFRIGTVEIPDDTRLSVDRRKLVNEEELTYSPYNQTEY